MKLLLHICCGPCASFPVDFLTENGVEFEGLYYNPNIQPIEEFIRRRDNVKILSEKYGFKTTYFDDFMQDTWESFKGTTDERCNMCYNLRINKAAEFASQNGFDAFTTSLLISPYQDHELICSIASEAAKRFGIDFYYHDFRPNYREGQKMAKDFGLYRQKYCGCICSLRGDGK